MVPPPSVAGSGNMAAPAVRRLGHATDAARSNEVSSATLPFHRYREKEKRRRPTPETPSPNEQAETIPNSTGKCKGSAAYPPQIAVMPDSSLEVAPMRCRSSRSAPLSRRARIASRRGLGSAWGSRYGATKCGAQSDAMAPSRKVEGALAGPIRTH